MFIIAIENDGQCMTNEEMAQTWADEELEAGEDATLNFNIGSETNFEVFYVYRTTEVDGYPRSYIKKKNV